MGSIRKLRNEDINTHLLLTSSSLSEMYIYDILKGKCEATRDSIYDVDTKTGFKNMLELVDIQSSLSEKWLFVITYSKVKSLIKDHKGIFSSDTSEFLIKVKNYKEYKEVKELLDNVNDIYLSYIKSYDVEFLLQKHELPSSLIDFISKSYYSDPEQVFVLLKELDGGRVVDSRKKIVEICGVSSGSVNTFALSLLKEPPKTEKGRKKVCNNRINVALELADTYGFSKMRNFLMASIKDILDIKTLYISGVIYDKIRDIPEVEVMDSKGEKSVAYDSKRLAKYNHYLHTIIEIPYTRILRLYLQLKEQGRWYKDVDMIVFIYQYYYSKEV